MKIRTHSLASFCIAALLMLPFAASHAAESAPASVYAVLSLIGDKLDVVVAQAQTGTRVDANRRQSIAIADAVFDNAAVSAVADAVRKLKPNAELAAINTRSTALFEKQRELFEQRGDTIQIPDAIRAALKNQGATHLFLITKRRDDAQAQFLNGLSDGKGRLEGLGFYLDGSIETKVASTGEGGRGFIAPFAYLNVALIEVASSKVIKTEKITASSPISAGRAQKDIGNPWEALSSVEKVRLVNLLIERELGRVVPELMM